jgi:UDP-N-acetylglucosamine:LPS N-acetylglucosamine transferase
VEGFCDKTLEYLAAADVFLGKSGASSVAEAAFFGLASIITKYATSMELDNAEYYLKDVQNAVNIFSAKRVVEQLEEWLAAPEKLKTLQDNALAYRKYYGSEASADVLWEMLCKQFPSLQNNAKQNGEKALESRVKKGLSKKEGKGKSRVKNAM